MTHPWPDLRWWNSGERQVVEEKIDDLKRRGVVCNPEKSRLYKALSATPEREVRVAVIGQDPYPQSQYATGLAFSIPEGIKPFPHTLKIILQEYTSDLHYPEPSHGDLSQWTRAGVLLWNAIPSCQSGRPLSNDWDEWRYLTDEIIDRLDKTGGIVFVFLGSVSARYSDKVDTKRNRVIKVSHPSPRGNRFGRTPFTGSRLFSTINGRLAELQKPPINWELSDVPPRESNLQTPDVDRGNVLPNITGVRLGGLKRTATSPNVYTSLAF